MLTSTQRRRRGDSWVRDLFCSFVDCLDNDSERSLTLPDDLLEEEGVFNTAVLSLSPENRFQWLTGQLWHCTSILPGSVCDSLDLRRGATYAQGARRLREEAA